VADRFIWEPGDLILVKKGGEVVIDTPEQTCAKIGHKWEITCHDAPDMPGYVRECARCGAAEISGEGHDWQPVRP
jgi:hypothetical protein